MGYADDIISQSARRLNELSTTAPIRWSRSELLGHLNEALNEINLLSSNYQKYFYIDIDNSSAVWDVDVDSISVVSISIGNKVLYKYTIEELDREYQWELTSCVSYIPSAWAPLGVRSVLIVPRPVYELRATAWCVSEYPTVIDAHTDMSSWVNPEYEQAIEDYIVSRAMYKEGGAEFQQASILYNRFLDTVQQLSGRNVIRQYPQINVRSIKPSEITLRQRSIEVSR